MKLNAHKVGLTLGLLWGLFLAILTILAVAFPPYGKAFLDGIVSVYPGYSVTWTGAIVGLIYGFIDFYIGGVVFVWLYNRIKE